MGYDVGFPDDFDGGDLGIKKSDCGQYKTFSEAKAAMIRSIDVSICNLKEYKKQIRSMKKDEA